MEGKKVDNKWPLLIYFPWKVYSFKNNSLSLYLSANKIEWLSAMKTWELCVITTTISFVVNCKVGTWIKHYHYYHYRIVWKEKELFLNYFNCGGRANLRANNLLSLEQKRIKREILFLSLFLSLLYQSSITLFFSPAKQFFSLINVPHLTKLYHVRSLWKNANVKKKKKNAKETSFWLINK